MATKPKLSILSMIHIGSNLVFWKRGSNELIFEALHFQLVAPVCGLQNFRLH